MAKREVLQWLSTVQIWNTYQNIPEGEGVGVCWEVVDLVWGFFPAFPEYHVKIIQLKGRSYGLPEYSYLSPTSAAGPE